MRGPVIKYLLVRFHVGQRVQVGVLPTLAHRVSGTLYVENNKTFFIDNFNYDGAGPGMLAVVVIKAGV